MLTILLIAAAVILLGGKDLAEKAAALRQRMPTPSWRQLAAAALIGLAVLSLFPNLQGVDPVPPPQPSGLVLKGLFAGPTAAEDAATVSGLTGELADELEWDGTLAKPNWATGVAIDDLRRRARELRCEGSSIGARQPAARDAIASHLESAVGVSGGPVDAAKRAAWVKALREISEAAADVAR